MKHTRIALACGLLLATGAAAAADSPEVQQLKQQMQMMQQQLQSMQQRMDHMPAPAATGTMTAQPPASVGSVAPPSADTTKLTTHIGGAAVTLYGFGDLSADFGKDGIHSATQVSSNLSYLGVRANKPLGSTGLSAIAQFETLVNVSGTPTESSGLGSRNSFVGLQGGFGKIMLGKTDTPYKRATAGMDPFASSIGDYNSIMGNTGGDLRAEFDVRVPHSIFYDSPTYGGLSVNLLFSPGQKFDNVGGSNNYAFAQGEKLCAGATPGSSGSTPDGGTGTCNDGAFTNAASASVNYQSGPLLATVSYERHALVNRTGDTGGVVSNESAAKIGATWNFGRNRLSGIFEKFYRNGGIDPAFNERARNGYYISDVQDLGNNLDLMGAWGHAGQTPGGPDFGTAKDTANMYSLGLKYHFDKQASVYLIGAVLKNDEGAHYALGAGGHGTAVASPRDGDSATIPGQTIKAVSVGVQYAF